MSELRWASNRAAQSARLEALLRQIPAQDWTLEHLLAASWSDLSANSLKRLIAQGVDVNPAIDYPPIVIAAGQAQPRITELLIASGANLAWRDVRGNSILQAALHPMYYYGHSLNSAWVLVANGMRISTTPMHYTHSRGTACFGPSSAYDILLALEKRVDRCRTAVATLLTVKDRRRLFRWDRFLLAEIAYAVWATRAEDGWE